MKLSLIVPHSSVTIADRTWVSLKDRDFDLIFLPDIGVVRATLLKTSKAYRADRDQNIEVLIPQTNIKYMTALPPKDEPVVMVVVEEPKPTAPEKVDTPIKKEVIKKKDVKKKTTKKPTRKKK